MRVIRVLLLVTWFVALFAGCASRQPTISQPTATSAPTPTPQLTATALAQQAPLLATLKAQKDFNWSIRIIQDGIAITAKNQEFHLQRKPFTLQIEASKPIPVYLVVHDAESGFHEIHAGLYANDNCAHGMHPFCSFRGMALATEPSTLYVDQDDELGTHEFDLDPWLGELGSQFTITNNSLIYERYVSRLALLSPSRGANTGPNYKKIPIEEFAREKLYLVFLAKHQDGYIISNDELQKFTLVFQ